MFRSGYVAVVGVPNVGKSTLLNKIIGEKVSIVTRKPQTTRHAIVGILNQPESQILFLDTPGFHESDNLLNERMLKAALGSLEDADLICHLIFPRIPLREIDQKIARRARELQKPYLVVINQIDTVTKETLLPIMEIIHSEWKPQDIIPLSALQGDGIDRLVSWIQAHLPEGPAYFPKDQYTNQTTRFLCAEIVREKAMKWLHQEIPYGLITQVEKFEEGENQAHIHVAIVVERESHKGIVIGKGGQMIKKIGTLAREDIEALLGKKVFLELFVKVVKGWTKDPEKLDEFGI